MRPLPTPAEVVAMLGALPDLCARLAQGEVDGPTRSARRTPTDPAHRAPTNLARLDALDTRTKREVQNHVDRLGRPHPDAHRGRVGQGEHRMGILPALWGWAVLLEDDMLQHSPALPEDLPEVVTIAGVCDWLARHADWWAARPQWDEFAPDVRAQHDRARGLVGERDDDDEPVTCPVCRAGALALQHVGLWQCEACGHEQTIEAVTLHEAAKRVGIHVRTLQRWALRPGLLSPVSDGPRSRLFDLGDVRRVVAEMKLRESG